MPVVLPEDRTATWRLGWVAAVFGCTGEELDPDSEELLRQRRGASDKCFFIVRLPKKGGRRGQQLAEGLRATMIAAYRHRHHIFPGVLDTCLLEWHHYFLGMCVTPPVEVFPKEARHMGHEQSR